MAQAHLTLQQAHDPEISFRECYMYGTSTSNQRIESWWAQLTKTATSTWMTFFRALTESNKYSNDVLADRISLLAVYFPTIRTDITHFVDNWNTHKIRKQPHRPSAVQGRPYNLFFHPREGVRNYGISLHEPTLGRLRQDVQDWSKSSLLCTKVA